MLDKNKNIETGMGAAFYTHVTQREAVACFDHEKYCQIGHTSMCHPKFDIMVLKYYWYLSVYWDQAVEPYSHTGQTRTK